MALKDLYNYAKKQEEQGKAPAGAKSSLEILVDAREKGIKGARSVGGMTTDAALQRIAAAKTQAVLGKALGRTTDPGKQEQLTSAIRSVAEDLNRKSRTQDSRKKKEEQQVAKTSAGSLPSQKEMAEDRLKHFDENADFDAASAHDRKRYDDQRKRLQMEADRLTEEAAVQQDTADIDAMSEEDRKALEQYAVNRVRDQNLPVEMAGKMPTAETESAAFIAKYGKQRADELAETFMRQENAQLAKQADAAGRKLAENRPVLASAATVPINLMSGIVGAAGQLQGAARATGRYRSLDANETGTALDKFSGAVRDQTAQNIEGDVYDERGNLVKDGGTLRKLGSLAYQGGMSFLDSTARMLVSGGSTGISSAIAASGAFSQGLQKYSAMGASPQQAALAATASAGLEYITEKLPTEQVLKIFHKGGGTNAVKEVLKQAFLVEPLGEEVNLFAGIAAEALILGENSSKAQRIGDLIAGGMSKAEAEKQFWKETFQEAAETYAVSAVAGGLGAGGAAYAGNLAVNNTPEARQEVPVEVAPAAPMVDEGQQIVDAVTAEPSTAPLVDGIQDMTPAPAPLAEGQRDVMAAMDGALGNQPSQQPVIDPATPQEETAPDVDTSEAVQMGASNIQQQSAEGVQGIKGTGAAEGNFSGKPAYNATLSEDNSQADRRDDVRPMELPQRDINGGNISATTANVYGSQNTPDDLASAMEEPVSRGDFSYVRISNDAATQRAQQTIGESGSWESARDNFRMDVDRGLAGAELSARGALILNHAAEVYEQAKASGDPQAAATAKREWLTILSDVQKLGTNTAQGLQALRIIRDLMPQDKIEFAQIAVQNMVRDMKLGADIQIDQKLLTDYENATTDQQRDEIMEKIQQNVADQIPSTILDKWNALRYTNMLGNLKTNVRNVAGNAANTAVYRFKDATGAVLESIANKVSGGKTGRTKSVIVNKQLQKAMDPYYQQVKNTISSGGKYGEGNTASGDFSQGVMDKRQIFKFKPLESYRKATNWMMNNEYFGDEAFGKAAFTRSLAGFLQANGVNAEQFQRMMDEKTKVSSVASRQIIPNGTKVRAADRQNYGTIQSYNPTDNTYLVHFVSPSGHTANVTLSAGVLTPVGKKTDTLGSVPKPEQGVDFADYAIAYAIREAQETTFHDNSALANVLGKLKKDSGVVGEGLIPFTKTPANVLTRAEEYSPLGIINTAVISAQKMAGNTRLADANGRLGDWAAKGQDITGTDIINSLSKTLTGSAIFALGAILKSQGILNGGPDEDDEQAAFDKMNGIQPYSINLPNGTTYTLDWLTPVAMPLFMGAQLMDIASDKDITFADLEQVFTSIADPMIQMSMMQGINSSLESIKYSDNNMGQFFINAAVNYLTQGLTNTLLGQLERSTEENRMTTYVDKDRQVPQWMQQQLGKMSQKVPGWDYQQAEYLNAWGQQDKNEGGLLYNLLSPGYISTEQQTAVTRELNRLRETTGENVFPQTVERSVNFTDTDGTKHTGYNLSEKEYETMQKVQGQISYRLMFEVISNSDYAGLTDKQKAEVMGNIYAYAQEEARKQALPKYYSEAPAWMREIGEESADGLIRRAALSTIDTSVTNTVDNIENGWTVTPAATQDLNALYDAYDSMSQEAKKQILDDAISDTAKFLEIRSRGVSTEQYLDVVTDIKDQPLQKGYSQIRDAQTYYAIAENNSLSDVQKDYVMKAYMPDYDPNSKTVDRTELKYDYMIEEGYSRAEFATAYDIFSHEKNVGGEGTADRTRERMCQELGIEMTEAKMLYKLFGGYYKPWE